MSNTSSTSTRWTCCSRSATAADRGAGWGGELDVETEIFAQTGRIVTGSHALTPPFLFRPLRFVHIRPTSRFLCMVMIGVGIAIAEPPVKTGPPPDRLASPEVPVTNFNLETPTAGGQQWWTDLRFREGYRLQRNALSQHHRLLDPRGVRVAWGDRASCLATLDRRRPWTTSDDDGRTVTVLLHGLMRSHHCMKPLAKRIGDTEHPQTFAFEYASTRAKVPEHADALQQVLSDWPPSWRIRFIGHSMGNIVVRHWITDRQRAIDSEGLLSRCESMVMLGPPNQGSAIAKRVQQTGLFSIIAGSGGMQMGPTFDEIAEDLAAPPFPFSIVAGDLSHWPVQNPLLDGPNDLLVLVDETRLEGAAHFDVVPVPHATLMRDRRSVDVCMQRLAEMTRTGP